MGLLFDVVTLFPGIFDGFLSESLLKTALEQEKLTVRRHNLRDWTYDRHHSVDDRPFGGGPGMVLKVDCVVPCIEDVQNMESEPGRLILLAPQGRTLTQPFVEELASENRLILLCGRYEGFDERVCDLLKPEEVSVGDYVLNGGEVAAMVLIDAVMRLLPGVLGDEESPLFDSFSKGNRLLEAAQYTRPREYRNLSVPDVLLSGDHEAIDLWRINNGIERTKQKRPDLLDSFDS